MNSNALKVNIAVRLRKKQKVSSGERAPQMAPARRNYAERSLKLFCVALRCFRNCSCCAVQAR